MPNLKSSKKDIRRSAKLRDHNRGIRSRLRTLAKKVRSTEDTEARRDIARQYVAALDKAAKTGIIHRNKADRHKSDVAAIIQAA